jgi:hypothetical protein
MDRAVRTIFSIGTLAETREIRGQKKGSRQFFYIKALKHGKSTTKVATDQ